MTDLQGATPSAPGYMGAHADILKRVVFDLQDEGSGAPPPLGYYPRVQAVLGYGVKMAQTDDGFLWGQLGGYLGDLSSWHVIGAGNPRDIFLTANYKGYNESSGYYSRPPSGPGNALWDKMRERFEAHLVAIFGSLCADVGWPPEKQTIELWNEAIPSGVGGKGVSGFTPFRFDPEMLPMLDWFARSVNRDFDGRGPRKLLASTLVAWYGGANYALDATMPVPEDRSFGEVTQSLKAINEWVLKTKDLNWHGLFDGISLNPYAPIGDIPDTGGFARGASTGRFPDRRCSWQPRPSSTPSPTTSATRPDVGCSICRYTSTSSGTNQLG